MADPSIIEIMGVLSRDSRQRTLVYLASEPKTSRELATDLGLAQSTVRRILHILTECRLVEAGPAAQSGEGPRYRLTDRARIERAPTGTLLHITGRAGQFTVHRALPWMAQ